MTDSKDTTAAQPQETVLVARLDATGIFQGTEQINKGGLTDAHVPLPNGCDLPVGQHRWNAERRTFVPVGGSVPVDKPAPNILRAIAIGQISLHDQGLTLPAETLAWLDSYIATIDFQGDFSSETVAMIKRFVARKGA